MQWQELVKQNEMLYCRYISLQGGNEAWIMALGNPRDTWICSIVQNGEQYIQG